MATQRPSGLVDLEGAVELLEAAIGAVVVDEVPVAMAHHLVGSVKGHEDLPMGGHDFSPGTVTRIPRGRPPRSPGTAMTVPRGA